MSRRRKLEATAYEAKKPTNKNMLKEQLTDERLDENIVKRAKMILSFFF
jgi:hypothetical protein